MAATGPFAAGNVNQTNTTTVAAAFAQICSSHAVLNSTARCNEVSNFISSSFHANAGKRAAGLCSSLRLCSSSLSSSCVVDVPTSTGVAEAMAAPLMSNCTINGPPSGSLVSVGVPTLTPLPAGKCTSASQCGDTAHFTCSANRATACACSPEGQDTCVELAECSPTPDGVCSSCVAGMLAFTRQFATGRTTASNNATAVAERWRTFCADNKYAPSVCGDIAGMIQGSFAGSLGKQAGRLCQLLGTCGGNIPPTCPVVTQLLSGQPVRQTLDLCTMEGVAGGSRVPGVSASAALAPGRCFNTADCKSESLECSMADAVTIYTCSQGLLSNTTQGTCVKTTCQVCRDCMAATQPFAVKQATTSNASRVAEEWMFYCQSNSLASNDKCAEVAASISTGGQMPGNLGKRAAGLCFALGSCSANICGFDLQLDKCTVQGLDLSTGGMLVPGVSIDANLPFGRCFNRDNCSAPADTCTPGTEQLCTCSDGVDTCLPGNLGTCAISQGGCSDCKLCLQTVQPFVSLVVADATRASTWASWCKANKATSSPDVCDRIQVAFGSSVNRFQRAGQLCQALQRCSQALAADTTCTLPDIPLGSGGKSGNNTRLDFCSAEGVTGGRAIPGISATKVLPVGKCQNDMQCGSLDLRCDTSSSTSFCYCEGGSDLCLSVGDCRRTPCAVCNDCLDPANRLTEATRFMQDNATVLTALDRWCSTPSLQAWAPAATCTEIRARISTSINVAKRAGLLCQDLGACNPATLPATCKLASHIASGSTTVAIKGGQLVRRFALCKIFMGFECLQARIADILKRIIDCGTIGSVGVCRWPFSVQQVRCVISVTLCLFPPAA